MELEGLKRCMGQLDQDGLTAEVLVTDRHPSVKKYMREQRQETKHYYDVWHVVKGRHAYMYIVQGQRAYAVSNRFR